MKRNITGALLLISVFGTIGYLLTENYLGFFSFFMTFILIFLMTAAIPYLFLGFDDIRQNNYSVQNIFLFICINHIVLIIGLTQFVRIYDNNFGDIEPLLGYIIFGVSLVINLLCLMRDLKKLWALLLLGAHVIVFLMFVFWPFVPMPILFFGFIYMVIHNIFVVSYGSLRLFSYITKYKGVEA